MSTTSTPARESVAKTAELTPGRSLPVSVMSSVSGRRSWWTSIGAEAIAAGRPSTARSSP